MGPSLAVLLIDASERFLGAALDRLEAAGYRGLSVSHAFAVQLIGDDVATITALSVAMRMTPQAVSAIVNQLEGRELVAKSRRAGDARARDLSLTEEGRRLALTITATLLELEGEWAELIGEPRLADARGALEAYVAEAPGGGPIPERRRSRRVRIS